MAPLWAAPAPCWVVRHHAPSAVHSVAFANAGAYLIAGDAKGRVSVTSMTDYRPRLFWDAHKDTVLRADAWGGYLVTTLDAPSLALSVEVNALNYCAYDMALCDAASLTGWLAVPHTLESAWIDIYALPQRRRVRDSVGRLAVLGRGMERPPIVMGVRLTLLGSTLYLVAGYEDGSVQSWTLTAGDDGSLSPPELLWSYRPHTESVMALCLTPDERTVVSVGADQRVVQIALAENAQPQTTTMQRPGHACVAVRSDARTMAVGGWDGGVRVFSLPAMDLLATLAYHKDGVNGVAYIRRGNVHTLALPADDSSDEEGPALPRHLLAAGSKDGRISLWDVPFTKDDAMPAL